MSPTPTESPSTPGRRERRRLEIRERLVEASRALFETKGYEDTTIAEICDRADVAYGTFFNHFPAKVDLLRVLVDRAVDSVLVGLETLAKQPGSITDHLVWLSPIIIADKGVTNPAAGVIATKPETDPLITPRAVVLVL
jgi:AcrR family transcriptional regulator